MCHGRGGYCFLCTILCMVHGHVWALPVKLVIFPVRNGQDTTGIPIGPETMGITQLLHGHCLDIT